MSKKNDAQGKSKRRKPGRPSILEVRKDPDLAKRAAEMRFLGHSWGEIGSSLGLARSTARRLALLYQKNIGCQAVGKVKSSVPKRITIDTKEGQSQYVESNIDGDVLERLPKTFQIFSSLLSRVRDMNRKTD
jgi:hypothetical protein